MPLPATGRFVTIQVVSAQDWEGCLWLLPAELSHAPRCRSARSAVCSKAAKLKTRSRSQIKAAPNHYS